MPDKTFFSLDILPARKGDCLLLHYGTDDDPRLWMIDGGPSNVYHPSLRPRLEDIKAARGLDDTQSLPVDLLMVSHVDDDHINGVLQFAQELQDTANAHQPLLAKVDKLWHNVFDDILGNSQTEMENTSDGFASMGGGAGPTGSGHDTAAIFASIRQGHRLRRLAEFFEQRSGDWRLNRPFTNLVMMSEDDDAPVTDFPGLNVTIIGPRKPEIIKLQKKWDKFLRDNNLGRDDPQAALAAAGQDRSISNLASIVALVECNGKTMLLTGDALGKKIVKSLEARGLASDGAPLVVDILKLQHHGSTRNVTPKFFKRVKATHYIFSGDGEHGNPERETVQMLLDEHDGRNITLHFSNPVAQIDAKRESEADGHGGGWVHADHALQPLLDQVTAADPSIHVSEPTDRKGIRINLLDEVTG